MEVIRLFDHVCRLFNYLLFQWKNCVIRGARSLFNLGTVALLIIIWSFFLSLTSMFCLMNVVISMGAAGCAVRYLGYTPGLIIIGLFAILILWMYASFWTTGLLFIIGGYVFSINHARLVILMATIYALYFVKKQAGWSGISVSINLAFVSNDVLNCMIQLSDNLSEKSHFEEPEIHKSFVDNEKSFVDYEKTFVDDKKTFVDDEFVSESEFSLPNDETEKVHPYKSSTKPVATETVDDKQKEYLTIPLVKDGGEAINEMKRVISCLDHYEALGFSRYQKIDVVLLKKEYRKKAMLVHPDKNMGSSLASESFKKIQCAYEVLSDSLRKRDYDDQLRKEESKILSNDKSPSSSHQENPEYCPEESRCIQCTKCGHSHIWISTNRTKSKARWCQDCCKYHQAKDGDGWVEHKGSLVFDRPQKVEIPRAFVCAESRIFDVSEWAICQGMACRPNTHSPSFHVNMVKLEKSQRSKSNIYPWDIDAEMNNEEEEFEFWLQQALAAGLFCETSKRKKSWSPFKLPRRKDGK
ncbi:hypothetical protein QVD17_38513 [Tagetes erecta]|uniref:J domain-containing protein n=1 Tax=Tagetes erecta TaxID=13708 RepID=A0AAD8JP12_TARER|nr:hypothetical protein QVD17_38513 [Tagetes erecta]